LFLGVFRAFFRAPLQPATVEQIRKMKSLGENQNGLCPDHKIERNLEASCQYY
jgi:hypothetical protein